VHLGKDRKILTIDKKLIQLRLGQSTGEETQPVHHNVVGDVVGCTVFDVGMCGDGVFMVVGLIDKVLVMKYNPELRQFCVRKVGARLVAFSDEIGYYDLYFD